MRLVLESCLKRYFDATLSMSSVYHVSISPFTVILHLETKVWIDRPTFNNFPSPSNLAIALDSSSVLAFFPRRPIFCFSKPRATLRALERACTSWSNLVERREAWRDCFALRGVVLVVDSRSESLRFGMVIVLLLLLLVRSSYVCEYVYVKVKKWWREIFGDLFSACQDRTDSV